MQSRNIFFHFKPVLPVQIFELVKPLRYGLALARFNTKVLALKSFYSPYYLHVIANQSNTPLCSETHGRITALYAILVHINSRYSNYRTCAVNGCLRKAIFSQCAIGKSRHEESARNTNYMVTNVTDCI